MTPQEIFDKLVGELGPEAFDAVRYADPDLTVPEHMGELQAAALAQLRASMRRD